MSGFQMLGSPDAVACEGDACIIPGAAATQPQSAQAAVVAALDEHTA
jgi:hypothetical protein